MILHGDCSQSRDSVFGDTLAHRCHVLQYSDSFVDPMNVDVFEMVSLFVVDVDMNEDTSFLPGFVVAALCVERS